MKYNYIYTFSISQLQWAGTINGRVSPSIRRSFELPCPMKFLQITCGRKHILGLLEDGAVASWGVGFFGQLGHGDDNSYDNPKFIQSLDPRRMGCRVVTIACGGSHSGVVTDTGKIFMWGLNRSGQCGTTSKSDSLIEPRPVDFPTNTLVFPTLLACGSSHTIMVTRSGSVYSWGAGSLGRLGIPELKKKQFEPVEVTALSDIQIRAIAVGDFHTLALSQENEVYSWGCNSQGQCGQGHIFHLRTPHKIDSFKDSNIIKLSCGSCWSMAITFEGVLYSWGHGDGGWLAIKPEHRKLQYLDPDNENTTINTPIKTCHTRSFESNYNLLCPVENEKFANYFVHEVRCGSGHAIFSVSPRTDFNFNLNTSGKQEFFRSFDDESHDSGDDLPDSDSMSVYDENDDDEDDAGLDDECKGQTSSLHRTVPSPTQLFSWCRHMKIEHLAHVLARGLVADINVPDAYGNTLLITACQNGHQSICKLLVENGADLNASNHKGNTALHYSFAFSFPEIGNYLIVHGADEFAVNLEGLTCYEGLSLADLDNI